MGYTEYGQKTAFTGGEWFKIGLGACVFAGAVGLGAYRFGEARGQDAAEASPVEAPVRASSANPNAVVANAVPTYELDEIPGLECSGQQQITVGSEAYLPQYDTHSLLISIDENIPGSNASDLPAETAYNLTRAAAVASGYTDLQTREQLDKGRPGPWVVPTGCMDAAGILIIAALSE